MARVHGAVEAEVEIFTTAATVGVGGVVRAAEGVEAVELVEGADDGEGGVGGGEGRVGGYVAEAVWGCLGLSVLVDGWGKWFVGKSGVHAGLIGEGFWEWIGSMDGWMEGWMNG